MASRAKDPMPAAPAKTASQVPDDFRVLYGENFTFVWRCLRGCGVPEAQIDDAVQEVFLVAHRRLRDFRGDSSVRTWLYGILRHVAANQRRTVRRRGAHEPLDPRLRSDAPDPEHELDIRQRAAFVSRFVAGLDDKQRDIFVLALLEQLAIPEVAEILTIPLNTAYTRLRAVRAAFQKALRRERYTS